MRQFFITVFGVVIGLFLFLLIGFILIMVIAMSGGEKEPEQVVLSLDLRGPVQDHSVGESLFGETPVSVVDIVQALDKAKTDDSIKGVFIRANGWGMAPASAEEIRLSIKDFRTSGKFVVAHSQGFEGTSFMAYHSISSADEIWQQATTGYAVSGIRSETPFYGGVAEQFDAKVDMVQFHEYKNAANVYAEKDFTDAHREATTGLLTSLYNTAVDQIAEDRNLEASEVNSLFEGAPHSAENALEAGLVDKLGHLVEAKEYAKDKAGGKETVFVSLVDYANRTRGTGTGDVIAFVGGQGPVVMGGSSDGSNPFDNSLTMGGDSVSAAFEKAIKDKRVKAIVFRVSTPGGSPTASDQIHNATLRAQEAGKPVIVSMGQYAASGGYYVSTHADKIVAMPSTITGSIGVLGGKIALRDTYAKIGYNVEAIDVGGEYVGAYSGDEPFTQAQRAAYRGQLSDIYDDFTGKVAEGRDIPLERVLEIAKGRVWTGEQALELGLVDELGGIQKAIELAKAEAGIDADQSVRIKYFPKPKTVQEQINDLFSATAETRSDLGMLRELVNSPEVQAMIEAKSALSRDKELAARLPKIE